MHTEPSKEHAWLKKFVGEWAFESECAGPDGASMKLKGAETVRMLGDLWLIGEGRGEMPGGGDAQMLLTIGFDSRKGRFVGSWIGSMMDNMFTYEGVLDATGKALPLETLGPSFADPSKTAKYRDTYALVDDDHRTLTSSVQNEDGSWTTFMTAHYRRVKR